MALPTITHLQFFILAQVAANPGGVPGRIIRAKLDISGIAMSLPAFYQFMARLEKAKFVSGRYEDNPGPHHIKERWYSLTKAGEKAQDATMKFYSKR